MREVPIMPTEYMGRITNGCGYTDTKPRKWTDAEIEWMKHLKTLGYGIEDIAKSLQRSETSVSVKFKRLGKRDGTYNSRHVQEKYNLNEAFLKEVNPRTILDLYCGERSFYQNYEVTTNDINESVKADYHKDAFRLICSLYSQGKKYDLIDLDPYGSAYDCIDLAIKMANKGLAITLGELGHKRWKRMDFVRDRYGIDSIEEFTIENLIAYIQRVGRRNKKRLVVWQYREWQRIGRVYFKIEKLKVTEQWSGENGEPEEDKLPYPRPIGITLFDLLEGDSTNET